MSLKWNNNHSGGKSYLPASGAAKEARKSAARAEAAAMVAGAAARGGLTTKLPAKTVSPLRPPACAGMGLRSVTGCGFPADPQSWSKSGKTRLR